MANKSRGEQNYYLSLKELKPETTRGKIVTTRNGQVEGVILRSRDEREFYAWHRIPYAKPPLGQLRFSDPIPAGEWEGVLDGSQYGSRCPQVDLFSEEVQGEEDCLFLNVFVPKEPHDEDAKLPVIVNIHGGAFAIGEGRQLKPDCFMDEDVVIVTINYRLDVLGFLSTGDTNARGNMGLKDQVVALRWIKENILFFGGDSEQITLMGQSAGACSVHSLMLSNLSQGLFQRGISQSGTATLAAGLLSPEEALKMARDVGLLFNCDISTREALVQCLRRVPLAKLFGRRRHQIWRESVVTDPSNHGKMFTPVIEAVQDDAAFFLERPIVTLMRGDVVPVPWLVGHTADEGLMTSTAFLKDSASLEKFESNWEVCVGEAFSINAKSPADTAKRIRNYYTNREGKESVLTFTEKFQAYTNLLTDSWFSFDTREAILLQRGLSPVYFFLYNKTDLPMPYTNMNIAFRKKWPYVVEDWLYWFQTQVLEFWLGFAAPFYGVDHCADGMLYMANGKEIQPGGRHYKYSKDFVRLLVDFASDKKKLEFRGIEFLPLLPNQPLQVLEFRNEDARLRDDPFDERFQFLRSLKFRDYHN